MLPRLLICEGSPQEEVKQLPANTVSCVITALPSEYTNKNPEYLPFLDSIFSGVKKIIKKNGLMWIYHKRNDDNRIFGHRFLVCLADNGWTFHHIFTLDSGSLYLFSKKSERVTLNSLSPDVFINRILSGKEEKKGDNYDELFSLYLESIMLSWDYREELVDVFPAKLILPIIKYSSPKEDFTVLDPFCNSGAILFAAQLLGGKAIGIETNHELVEIALKRCSLVPHK